MKTKLRKRTRPRKLTPHQIACIGNHLHEKIQFYNAMGYGANEDVLRAVEHALKSCRFT